MKTEIQNEDLKEEVQHIESETRMILPGIQALFGFQLVAVFNDRFETALTSQLQLLHWLALGFTAVATVFAIAPVAYHRIAVPHIVTRHFVSYSNLCIKILLLPLILGCTIDFFLIGTIVTKNSYYSLLAASFLFTLFAGLWFVYPLLIKRAGKSL